MTIREKDVLNISEVVKALSERDQEISDLKAKLLKWESTYEKANKRKAVFNSGSGTEISPLYTDLDRAEADPELLGLPGNYPYTRGPYATMYRSKLWTMRQFAGFATAEDTNARYKYLLDHGQTGLSVAFDFPTLMGFDSDHSRSLGEVGVCGVAVSSTLDMEELFEGIPLDKVSVSMTCLLYTSPSPRDRG